jgi:hypothetical protein
MLKFADIKNIEAISVKLATNFIKTVDFCCNQAIRAGAIRIHPTSTHFFSIKPKNICAAVANYLTESKKIATTVSAVCKDICYILKINLATVITVWKIDENILNIVSSKNTPNLKTKYYLILIYREMYDPSLIGSFLDNKMLVSTLSKKNFKSTPKKGGIGDIPLYAALQEEIFVGKKAYNYLLDEPMESGPYDIISASTNKTVQRIQKLYPACSHSTADAAIFNDYMLKITTVRNGADIICRIYNSAEYELIPFIQADVRVGCVYVVSRWVLIKNLLERAGPADKSKILYGEQIHDRLIVKIFDIPHIIPATKNYYGTYISQRAQFSLCEMEKEYKPRYVKKKLGNYIYFV